MSGLHIWGLWETNSVGVLPTKRACNYFRLQRDSPVITWKVISFYTKSMFHYFSDTFQKCWCFTFLKKKLEIFFNLFRRELRAISHFILSEFFFIMFQCLTMLSNWTTIFHHQVKLMMFYTLEKTWAQVLIFFVHDLFLSTQKCDVPSCL